jgi:diaminopimelate decarboxylase
MNRSPLPTPYYLIDLQRLQNNYNGLHDAFRKKLPNIIIGYSFKTNSLPWLIRWMKQMGAYAEVVSSPEYQLALRAGFDQAKVVFNGPYKGFDAFFAALESGALVNLDSFHEIEWLKMHRPVKMEKWQVGLRINFDLESQCPGETIMGDKPGRFGFNFENGSFNAAVSLLKKLPYIHISGIHAHHSTKTRSLKVFNAIVYMIGAASRLIPNPIAYIDIGGCLFGDKPGGPTFDAYAETIAAAASNFFDLDTTTVIVEPGAALIASPVSFYCSVIDVKTIGRQSIVTTDGSIMNVDPLMHGTKFEITCDCNISRKPINTQVITGCTCIEKDRMATIEGSGAFAPGDLLAFHNTGAYTMALSPLFIQYYPAVYIKDGDRISLVRTQWGAAEYEQGSFFPGIPLD